MSEWALVTGAARRIGRAIALEMAARGWNVAVHYRTSRIDAEKTAGDIRALGREACLAEIDLANGGAVARLIPALAEEIGPLAALVNNASLFESDSRAPAGDLLNAVNFEAPRILGETFRAQVPHGKQGAIVNIVDDTPPEAGFDAYARSKRALRDMTVEMALRFAPHVRVNGISPGSILPSTKQSQEHFRKLVAASPMRAEIPPQAIAAAVRFLIESPAITGEILHVDGGAHLRGHPGEKNARIG